MYRCRYIYLVFLEKPQVSIEITKNPRETPRNENSPLIPQETRKFAKKLKLGTITTQLKLRPNPDVTKHNTKGHAQNKQTDS